jgi:hypothetical protein
MKNAKSLGSVGKSKQEVLQFESLKKLELEVFNKTKLPPNTSNYKGRE